MKVLMDSSGSIEFFTDGPLADRYAAYLTSRYQLITPTMSCTKCTRRSSVSGAKKPHYRFGGKVQCDPSGSSHRIHRASSR